MYKEARETKRGGPHHKGKIDEELLRPEEVGVSRKGTNPIDHITY